MVINQITDRRHFLAGLGAAAGLVLVPARGIAETKPMYISACTDAAGKHAVASLKGDGRLRFTTALPDRGHDIVSRPAASEIVVFARRSGNWAAIIDLHDGKLRKTVTAPKGRHLYGHGAFSADGRRLYTTENNIDTGQGVIGLYDAHEDYRRIGEYSSFGIGPHDLAFLPGHKALVIANGGIRTHPQTGREMLNKDDMEPSLVMLDPVTGQCLGKVDLGKDLKGLSIRHLAVAADGTTVFGCQFEGDVFDMPLLVGTMLPDMTVHFLDMPDEDLVTLNNYVGSVELDKTEEIVVATSPRGGMAAFWERRSGRYLGRRAMPDVCGVAPMPIAGSFLFTSGNMGVESTTLPALTMEPFGQPELRNWQWDNHMIVVG